MYRRRHQETVALDERKIQRFNSCPTLYEGLERCLETHGLSWNDVEGVAVRLENKTEILSKEKSKEILSEGIIISAFDFVKYSVSKEKISRTNTPFYAYTKERIFLLHCDVGDGDTCNYYVDSVPRNLSDKEEPKIF